MQRVNREEVGAMKEKGKGTGLNLSTLCLFFCLLSFFFNLLLVHCLLSFVLSWTCALFKTKKGEWEKKALVFGKQQRESIAFAASQASKKNGTQNACSLLCWFLLFLFHFVAWRVEGGGLEMFGFAQLSC